MIDFRHAYMIARKIDGEYFAVMSKRAHSTMLLISAEPEPIRRTKIELEKAGAKGLVMVRVIDNMIVEVTDDRASETA